MRTVFRISLCIFALSFSAGAVRAGEESRGLTLAQCLELARERSDDLKIRRERQVQAEQRLAQARGGLRPSFGYGVSAFERDDGGGAYSGEGTESRLYLSQPLFNGFAKRAALNLSRSDLRAQRYHYSSVDRALGSAVTEAFYSVAQILADRENLDTTLKLMQDRQKELAERVRLGKSRESELLVVESQIAILRAEQEKDAGELAKAIETLSYLTGVPPADLAIEDEAPLREDVAPVESYLSIVERRSDVEAARQDALAQSFRVQGARGALLPSMNLDAAWYTKRSASLAGSDWEAYLTLAVPLYQGGTARGRVNEEISRLREYNAAVSLAARNAAAEVKKLHAAYVSAVRQAAALREAYAKADKSYRMQLRDYRFGLVNNLDVIQALTSMLDVKRSLDRAQVQARNAQAQLRIAVQE